MLHPADAPYMAAEIAGRRYVPLRALFGGSLFPQYISTVITAVVEILRAKGIPAVVMMDDIFICGTPNSASDPESCAARLARASAPLERMGFKLNSAKTLGPAQQLTFKGMQIDSVRGRLSIDEEKLALRVADLDDCLDCSTWSHRDSEVLLGQLGWIVSVLQAGRPHLARLRHGMQYWRRRSYKQPITADQHEAMRWFRTKSLAALGPLLASGGGCHGCNRLHGRHGCYGRNRRDRSHGNDRRDRSHRERLARRVPPGATGATGPTGATGATAATSWTSATAADQNPWASVTYGMFGGQGVFVAVAEDDTTDSEGRVMYSIDGSITCSGRARQQPHLYNGPVSPMVAGRLWRFRELAPSVMDHSIFVCFLWMGSGVPPKFLLFVKLQPYTSKMKFRYF